MTELSDGMQPFREGSLKHPDSIRFYRDERHEWRWRREAANGEIIAVSGEGYLSLQHCIKMAVSVNGWPVCYLRAPSPTPE